MTRFLGGAGLSSVLTKQKDLFVEATELASALAKIYTRNAEIDWPNVSCQLEYQAFAIAYRDCWTEINSVFRTSAAIVSTELALQPLFAAVTSIGPEIDQVFDYISFSYKMYFCVRLFRRLRSAMLS